MYTEIPEDIIENIRQENDIVDVIEEYVQLKKQGKNHFGLCPFHEEKTPSFSVTKEKQIFHCFGCGKGGNVFSFIMEVENMTYIETVQFLARRANITLSNVRATGSTYSPEVQQLLSAYDWLMKYYHHLLRYSDNAKEALKYIR